MDQPAVEIALVELAQLATVEQLSHHTVPHQHAVNTAAGVKDAANALLVMKAVEISMLNSMTQTEVMMLVSGKLTQ